MSFYQGKFSRTCHTVFSAKIRRKITHNRECMKQLQLVIANSEDGNAFHMYRLGTVTILRNDYAKRELYIPLFSTKKIKIRNR